MQIQITRNAQNPLIRPEDVKPTRPGFKVEGVFNCGAAIYKGETILLCRVAESAIAPAQGQIAIPIVANQNGLDAIETVVLDKTAGNELDFSDSRQVTTRSNGRSAICYLTSLSHLRVARSSDGIHFEIDEKPSIMPNSTDESWGMEDPRITQIGDTYYINYTSVTPNGASTSMMKTTDFETYERCGVIFLPENKDVVIFPRKISGSYYAMTRPVPNAIGNPDIWLSSSPDLLHWGGHRHLCGVTGDGWEGGRIGGGAVPVETEHGWLEIYHAADKSNRYCLGAMLFDKDNPGKILKKSREPLAQPETKYETDGFFGNVVFTCGCILQDGKLVIYYGASDETICRMDITLNEIYRHLEI